MQYTIYKREKTLQLNDPRCYDGHFYDVEIVWTVWSEFMTVPEHKVESSLKFWRELNAYAISQRGKNAVIEYMAEPSK